jgi:hypothetical protein
MGCQFFGMGLLESINGLVVLPEIVNLLFEFLDSIVETSLDVHHLSLHFSHFLFVLSLKVCLFGLESSLVLFKLSLTFLFLLDMVSFKIPDFCFPRISFLSLCYHILLL